MANALRVHGPDRSEVLVSGNVGLVHVLMRMTPEDRFDRQPWRGASGAIITADLRLDNRDEVLARIGIDAAGCDGLAGFARAARRLGEIRRRSVGRRCAGRSLSAIWNPRRRARLTLARDHLGLNVVMCHKAERFFAFATMPKGLFAVPDVPRELSEEKMRRFPRAQSRRPRDDVLSRHFSRPPGAPDDHYGRRRDGAAALLVAGRHPAAPANVRSGLCGWPARMS